MKSLTVKKRETPINETFTDIASDKSISHRCAIFSLLSDEPSFIENYLEAEDTLNTLSIVEKLGAKIEKNGEVLKITPPKKIKEPPSILDCGNSGTAMRLLMGFLASKEGFFVLHGDKYLSSRPMKRVSVPLNSIGAKIDGRENGNLSPIAIRGNTKIKPFDYESKIASAQVKSAMILAALNATDTSTYKEPHLSRDHTERMLRGMGANIEEIEKTHIKIHPVSSPLKPLKIKVPSDPSSAFFFAVAASIIPGSKISLKNVSLNPTRVEAFKVLKRMGAKITFNEKENIYEPIGEIVVEYSRLKGVEVSSNIAWLIDELPALSIAMACAEGKSVVKNAKELRVKESDRIKSVVENLKKCGINIKEFEDGYEIEGGEIKETTINSHGDHRIAMSFAIAGLKSSMRIDDIECISTSFPNFIKLLNQISEVKVFGN